MWRLRLVDQLSAEEHEKLAEEMKLCSPFLYHSNLNEFFEMLMDLKHETTDTEKSKNQWSARARLLL